MKIKGKSFCSNAKRKEQEAAVMNWAGECSLMLKHGAWRPVRYKIERVEGVLEMKVTYVLRSGTICDILQELIPEGEYSA